MTNSILESRSMDINQADWNICPNCKNRVKTIAHDNTKCQPVAYCATHSLEYRGICGSCIGEFGYFD
jgi:hypothetical protein